MAIVLSLSRSFHSGWKLDPRGGLHAPNQPQVHHRQGPKKQKYKNTIAVEVCTLRGSVSPSVIGMECSTENFAHSVTSPLLNLLVNGPE